MRRKENWPPAARARFQALTESKSVAQRVRGMGAKRVVTIGVGYRIRLQRTREIEFMPTLDSCCSGDGFKWVMFEVVGAVPWVGEGRV